MQRNMLCRSRLEASNRPESAAAKTFKLMENQPTAYPKTTSTGAKSSNYRPQMSGLLPPNVKKNTLQGGNSEIHNAENLHPNLDESEDDTESFVASFEPEEDAPEPKEESINIELRADWQTYCERSDFFGPLSPQMKKSVKLMAALRKTKASLDTYESVMEWHLKCAGSMPDHGSLGICPEYLSRKSLFDALNKRYHMDTGYLQETQIVLPHNNARANIVWNDAAKVIQSLLTDPRITPDDYLFFGKNPFAPPPLTI